MSFSVNYPDPHSDTTIVNAYAWAIETNFNFLAQRGRIVFGIYKDEASATAGKQPLGTIAIDLTPGGTPASYGPAPLITPGQPAVWSEAVYDEEGNLVTPSELITPAVGPVYGEAPLIAPALPSFGELVQANLTAYGLLAMAVDNLAKGQTHQFDVVD